MRSRGLPRAEVRARVQTRSLTVADRVGSRSADIRKMRRSTEAALSERGYNPKGRLDFTLLRTARAQAESSLRDRPRGANLAP